VEIRITRKDGLLIGSRVHQFGARVEVADGLGHRFIKAKAATPALDMDDDEPGFETASIPPADGVQTADAASPHRRIKKG
jgi:hypothetical protein